MVSEIISSIVEFLITLRYTGIALGLMIEVIPSEIVLSYAGYLISLGEVNFYGALFSAVIGGTMAQLFLYWLGVYGGRPLLVKYGKYLFISEKSIVMSEKWFEKYGGGVIFFARFIPIVRHAISIPAGLVKMNTWKFTIYTVAAIIPWSIFFILLGENLGTNWRYIKTMSAPFIPYFIVTAIVALVVYFFVKKKGVKIS